MRQYHLERVLIAGTLYVVATPIGNLGDFAPRAIKVLKAVQLIAAEDTRRSRPLLTHFGIATPLCAMHEHNERTVAARLLQRLENGETIALISDAGTPLISDPGFHLVREARRRGIRVVPVPGPNAAICALSAAGLPSDRFVFEGFLPSKGTPRKARLAALTDESRTLVFYESSHRITRTLTDMAEVLGSERQAVVGRELTKRFESMLSGTLGALSACIEKDPDQQKGEFVVVVGGASRRTPEESAVAEQERILTILLEYHSPAQAAKLAARITGGRRNALYALARELVDEDSSLGTGRD